MSRNNAYLQSNTTVEGDEVYTPFYAVEPLLEFLPKEKITIWCPFDEDWSAYVQTFKERGYNVIYSSIKMGEDFFEYEPKEHYDLIISNPPFSKKDEVLARLYELDKPFAILLPVNSIQGKKRHSIFANDIQLLVFDGRVDYHTWGNFKEYKTGNHFGSAYFCRNFLPDRLVLRDLKKYQKPLKQEF